MHLKIFIVYHDKLYFDNYLSDPSFSDNYFTFLKVGDKPDKYKNLSISDFPNYIPLGKHYAESEAIYNVYKNPEIYEGLDYIGFSQYDKPHILRNGSGLSLTDEILKSLAPDTHISLESYLFETDFNQNIMMDDKYPNELTGFGLNAYTGILRDYNKHFGTNYDYYNLKGKEINLCSSFILPIGNWLKIMGFIAAIIESKKLDKFDTERQHRIQGGLLERYIGVAILFEHLKSVDLSTEHFNLK